MESSFNTTGIPSGQVCFGGAADGSIVGTSNFTFNSGTNILTTVGGFSTPGSVSTGSLTTTANATIGGSLTVAGSANIIGNETLHGTLTTGSMSIAATNPQGYVNVTALSAGPVGHWLTTGISGVVNWNAYPSIAAGWTDTGTQIYSNPGEPVRVNNFSGGPEIFNVAGTSVFQANVAVTAGGLNLTGPLTVSNGHGNPGQVLVSNGTGSTYWSNNGGLTGTVNVTPNGAYKRIPFSDSFHDLDASDDLAWDSDFGPHRGMLIIDASARLGNQKLQVNDDTDGLGCAIFRTTSDKGVEINDPGTNIGGANNANINLTPNGVNTLLYLNTFTPGNNWTYFLCAQPTVVGGPLVIKAFMTQGGSLALAGTLSAGTKPFSIAHPLPELSKTKNLVHMAVESAKSDLIYRGKVQLSNGKAEINLDKAGRMTEGTLSHLVDLDNGEAWIQNKTSFAPCQGSISGNKLIINCQDASSDDMVSWLVMLERIDKTVRESGLCDEDGRLICEHDRKELDVTG